MGSFSEALKAAKAKKSDTRVLSEEPPLERPKLTAIDRLLYGGSKAAVLKPVGEAIARAFNFASGAGRAAIQEPIARVGGGGDPDIFSKIKSGTVPSTQS